MGSVVIFAPSPVLTVTIEDVEGTADIHLHAGGQGVWQARMLKVLGAEVTMCAVFAGEAGGVLQHLIDDEGVNLLSVSGEGSSGAYVHDRRDGERDVVAESPGHRLTRHELDELYGLTLQAGMKAGTVILSGTGREDSVPPDMYRRLTTDLRTAGCTVIADLAGERLKGILEGKPSVVKMSDEEVVSSGRADASETDLLVEAMRTLTKEGAQAVIITRAHEPSLFLADGEFSEIHVPRFEAVETSGAGDSLTAAVAAVLADGGTLHDAVVLGTAAGAHNVTRHGLGSGEASAIHEVAKLVKVVPLDASAGAPAQQQASPDELARKAKTT